MADQINSEMMMARFAPILPAMTPNNNAPKNAMNCTIRITRIKSLDSMPNSCAPNNAETTMTVCTPSLYNRYAMR